MKNKRPTNREKTSKYVQKNTFWGAKKTEYAHRTADEESKETNGINILRSFLNYFAVVVQQQ